MTPAWSWVASVIWFDSEDIFSTLACTSSRSSRIACLTSGVAGLCADNAMHSVLLSTLPAVVNTLAGYAAGGSFRDSMRDADGQYRPRYDPAIAVPFGAMTPELAEQENRLRGRTANR